ncbi:hypothetical protein EI77_00480 [Prosthecobacter fusiformis]|uniref:Uncharacterized protein n=1 Tax=Prosthecobacter fusiformis TaxID=48464 RepID=A0A4R7SSI5_9BACT|nr:hypothetical protein [Prosthecobacter fusiformis]TDU81177.1 hypothetical protein EI77_00480 [Prosthecobacter fusiformis]
MKATFQAAEPQPLISPRVRKARHHPRAGRILSVALLLGLSWVGLMLFLGGAMALWQAGGSLPGWIALAGLLFFTLGRAAAFVLSRHLNCTLCHGPVLQEKSCHKHSEAVRIPPLSYRSSTVLSLLTSAAFRCMYCGTPYRLKK